MDMTAIAGAQAGAKALFGLARTATAAVVDQKVKQQLIDMQTAVLDIQAKLGDAHSERLQLLEQVAELRFNLRSAEAAKIALDAYELFAMDQGKFLYRYKAGAGDAPQHFACPSCYSNGKVTVLQSSKTASQQRLYACKVCNFALYVGPSDPKPPRKVISRGYFY
jgi:predicted RNA-binding Zn-ribbon protein involved in translation (DUF1610 family)